MKASELIFSQTQGETNGTETTLQGWPQGVKKPRLATHRIFIYPCTRGGNPPEQSKLRSPKDFSSSPGKCLRCAWRRGAEKSGLAPEPAKAQPVQGNAASAPQHLADPRHVHVSMCGLRHRHVSAPRGCWSAQRRSQGGQGKYSPLKPTACKEQKVLLKHPSGKCLQRYCQDHASLLLDSVCLQLTHCST